MLRSPALAAAALALLAAAPAQAQQRIVGAAEAAESALMQPVSLDHVNIRVASVALSAAF